MANRRNRGISVFTSGNKKETRFIQVGNCFLNHPKVTKLSPIALKLYLCMLMEAGGKPETELSHGRAKKYGIPSTTFDRAKDELIKEGFIVQVSDLQMRRFAKSRFRFSLEWKKQRIDSS